MSQILKSEHLSLPGQAGELEALIEAPSQLSPAISDPPIFAVICHPHPLHGGTLNNKVVYTIARAFQDAGAATIRFNFRGVGASKGGFGNGLGETEDALAAIAYGRNRWPGATLWLGGFSFGGAVAMRAASIATAAQLVTVAPAISRVDVSTAAVPDCPWLIVQGDADEVVDPQAIIAWAARLTPAPQVTMLAGVGHVFHGRLHELRATVTDYLNKQKPG